MATPLETARGAAGRDGAVDLLRAAAMALIVNSHLDGFYPVPWMATGGALGNALFFFLSGYCLAGGGSGAGEAPGIAHGRETQAGFARWYRRRICRIYPAVAIAVVLFAALPGGAWRAWGLREVAENFVWPTAYWFVGALMLFYAAFYLLRRAGGGGAYLAAIAALFVPYLAWYFSGLDLSGYVIEGEGRFKWIHYCQVLLFGAWAAPRFQGRAGDAGRDVRTPASRATTAWLATLGASALCYALLLFAVAAGRAGALQGLTHLLIYPLVLSALRLARGPWVARRVLARPGARAAAAFAAGITLELYLVQGPVRSLPWVQAQVFPLNVLGFGALLLTAAWLLNRAARLLARGVGCAR